jgi:hypothetical protein
MQTSEIDKDIDLQIQMLQKVEPTIRFLLTRLPSCLPDNLGGLYLRGSLAMGGFRPESSDIDLLVVTYQRVKDGEFASLVELHNALAASDLPFANRIEIAYIDQYALRRYQPGQRFPTMGQGETLAWAEHHANWILERWVVRERGIALFGPLPITLIDPISRAELVDATRARLQDWAVWASDINDPEWQWPRRHKFYVVETMCRSLHTLATGELGSKAQAVAWALQALPEPWRALVERSRAWQVDETVDESLIEPVRDFVLWTAQSAAGQ